MINCQRRMLFVAFMVTLATFVVCGTASADHPVRADSGQCGEHVSYSYDYVSSTLRITGEGEMSNYSDQDMAPWSSISTLFSEVIIDENVTSIGSYAFHLCSGIRSVTLPSTLRTIGENAFNECSNLNSITIPEGVTTINEMAFVFCSSLESISIPSSVVSFGDEVFGYCSALTSINVDVNNEEFESIDGVLFNKRNSAIISYPCGKGNNYTIPDGITLINKGAFSGCTLLSSVTIPSTVYKVYDYAFDFCTALTTIVFLGSYAPLCSNTAISSSAVEHLWVPIDYNARSFCTMEVIDLDSPSFNDVREQHNNCFEVLVLGENDVIVRKRANATAWEGRTNGCVEYQCSNQSGKVSWNRCNNSDGISRICMNDECVKNDTAESENVWRIIIDVEERTLLLNINMTEVLINISQVCDVDSENLEVAVETDDEGYVIRIYVTVNDERDANKIVNTINDLNNGQECSEGILCKCRDARIIVKEKVLSASLAVRSSVHFVLSFSIYYLIQMMVHEGIIPHK